MSNLPSPSREDKVRVLIWPAEGQYAAMCLETSNICVEPTQEEAARTITSLIGGQFLSGLRKGCTLDELFFAAPQQYQHAYPRARDFSFTATEYLPPEAQALIREIEYRFYSEPIPL